MAFDASLQRREAKSDVCGRLSLLEKAMLFDAAIELAASQGRDVLPSLGLREAQLLTAFASAYVAIRDRSDGLV